MGFDGDATKIIFGFCISDCSGTGSNANAVQAAGVMNSLRDHHPCNGGAFFWVAAHDTSGSWSQIVSDEISPYSGCSDAPTVSKKPTPPTTAPVNPPATPTLPPAPITASPTKSPVQGVSCPTSYTGLIPANDCTEFYHCADGSLVSEVPIYCPEGLLYKTDEVCMCNFVFVL